MRFTLLTDIIPNEGSAFSVLLWGVGVVVPAMVAALYVLWKRLEQKDEAVESVRESYKTELKEERDYIKSEGKETTKILNNLTEYLSEIARGVSKDIPKELTDMMSLIKERTNEIKSHIDKIDNKGGK